MIAWPYWKLGGGDSGPEAPKVGGTLEFAAQ